MGETTRAEPCPTKELTEQDARNSQSYVDFFKRNNVRVVNMSWGGSVKGVEEQLELCNIGKTPAERKALAREYFADGFYPRGYAYDGSPFDRIFFDGFDGEEPASGAPVDVYNPTGAVMKAVLLNATVPTTSPAIMPNTSTGWGRPWLDGNLWFKDTMPGGDDSRRLRVFERPNAAGLETGDVNEYVIDHVEAGVEFRATLTWFDAEAAAGAASTLVNNLDLEVVGPDNTTYLGNQFSGSVSVAGGSPDAKDTVEQVRFAAPIEGRYVIRVKAASVPGVIGSHSLALSAVPVRRGSMTMTSPPRSWIRSSSPMRSGQASSEPCDAWGLAPMATNRSVRRTSGTGIDHMPPYIRWELTFFGHWSTTPGE